MKAKFKILIIALLAVALSVMVLAACSNSGNHIKQGVIEGELPDYDYNKEAAFGEAPMKISVLTAGWTRRCGRGCPI